MTGEELREFISANGYTIASFAQRVGVSEAAVYKAVRVNAVSEQMRASVGLLRELELAKKKAAAFDMFAAAVGESLEKK